MHCWKQGSNQTKSNGRGEPFYAVNIYEFDNSKIVKIWFISNSSTTQRSKN